MLHAALVLFRGDTGLQAAQFLTNRCVCVTAVGIQSGNGLPQWQKTLFWTLQTTFVIDLICGESNYDNFKCIWMELSANHGTCVCLLLTWRIHEVKVHQIINPQLLQLQHHRAQVRPQDLRIRVVLCQVRGTSESQDHSKCISQDLIISSCVSLICQIAPRHGVRGIWNAI